jgi:hypothetical protein
MLKTLALSLVVAAAAPSCGRKDAADQVADHTPRNAEALPKPVTLDGRSVDFVALTTPVSYAGALAPQDDTFAYSVSRAFALSATETLRLEQKADTSGCAGAELSGPNYMVLRLEDGKDPQIVRSTEGVETGGGAVAATALAGFPGELPAGTYVLTVDYVALAKACDVAGEFTLKND